MGRPKKIDRTRIQLRSSNYVILGASKLAASMGMDRNSWICRVLTTAAKRGLPKKLHTEAAIQAVGGERDNLTIDVPTTVAAQITKRSQSWGIPRSTWINLALAEALKHWR